MIYGDECESVLKMETIYYFFSSPTAPPGRSPIHWDLHPPLNSTRLQQATSSTPTLDPDLSHGSGYPQASELCCTCRFWKAEKKNWMDSDGQCTTKDSKPT